jgi:hypothetical protein
MSANDNSRKELIMDNRLRLIVLIFALSLLALPLTGWAEFGSGRLIALKVDTPKNGSTVNTPTVTVSGLVGGSERKDAKVSVNNIDAPVTNGKYSANVTLTEGKNVIKVVVVATYAQDNVKEQVTVTVTYVPTKK